MNISHWIDRHARFTPNKIALYFESQTVTYAELAEQIEHTAQRFQQHLGIERGDRVSILALNVPEYLIALFACARIGAMLNPLNWRLAVPELLYIITHAESKALLVEEAFGSITATLHEKTPDCHIIGLDYAPENGQTWNALMAADSADAAPPFADLSDPLLLVYTSGTTGHPKGAVLSQKALLWNAIQSEHMQDLTSSDCVLTCLPLFHVGGLNNQTTPALHAGASVVMQRRFVPNDVLAAIDAADSPHPAPTVTCLVPATMQACLASPRWTQTNFSQLRLNMTGSMIVPSHLSDQFREAGVPVLEMYGCTETCPIAIYQRLDSDFSKRGSTGLAGLHCEVQVVDNDGQPLPPLTEGEIWLRGPHIMSGYWRNSEATAAALTDGWFHTGDIGHIDADGYVFIKDRKKNMIISGGENIYAAEVERVLTAHEKVIECALIGAPDEKWGERPVAVVVCEGGVSADDLRTFIKEQLARYKQPRHYHFVDALPKNALGKVQHFKVKEAYLNNH